MSSGKKLPVKHNQYGKRFNNGHKCFTSAESTFMQEIYAKNEKTRVHFNDTYHLLKKPRDPTMGELTSREDAEYLVPLSSIAEQTVKPLPTPRVKSQQELESATEKLRGTTMFSKLLADVARCESLRQRREVIDRESAMVESLLLHKQICVNAGFVGPAHLKGSVVAKTAQELAVSSRPF